MSTKIKLRGGTESELTRLKRLWCSESFYSSREFWREKFASELKQPEIRALIKSKLQINLQWNRQLTEFIQWLEDQDRRDAQAERVEENTRRIQEQHPDWTLEQVREEVLRQSYLETLATGDFKTGLKTVAAHSKVEAIKFDQEKFKEGLRSKLEAGLAQLAEHIKGNPKAKEAYEKFRATITETTK